MATLDKSSKHYDISATTKKFTKFLCKRKCRRLFKKGININSKKLIGRRIYCLDKYW